MSDTIKQDIKYELGIIKQLLDNLQSQYKIQNESIIDNLEEMKTTLKSMDEEGRKQAIAIQELKSMAEQHDKWIEKHEIFHNDDRKTKSSRNWQLWISLIMLVLAAAVGWIVALLK